MTIFAPYRPPLLAVILFCVSCGMISGCAMSTGFYREVDRNLKAGRFGLAAEEVDANRAKYPDNSRVLFNLESGLLYHYAGEFDRSSARLLAAEKEMDDLYTKSVSTAAGSLVLNDNLLPYEGEDFEKVYVNLILALNYARLGRLEDAIVEARKVDLKLNEYSKQYNGKNSFKQDAFVRYIMGALYEADGEINDAFISYKLAYKGYQAYDTLYRTPCPSFLKADLIRTAGELRFDDELQRYEDEFGMKYVAPPGNQGGLLLVIHSGRGPVKSEVKLKVSIEDKDGTSHTFVAAVPKFRERQTGYHSYEIAVGGTGETVKGFAEVAEDVNAIAAKDLDERIGLIYLKTAGRALLKYLASEEAKKQAKKVDNSDLGNFLASSIVDAAYDASEKADVRTWRSLPHDIQIMRMQLPAGEYSFSINDAATSEPVAYDSVTVRPGRLALAVVTDVR